MAVCTTRWGARPRWCHLAPLAPMSGNCCHRCTRFPRRSLTRQLPLLQRRHVLALSDFRFPAASLGRERPSNVGACCNAACCKAHELPVDYYDLVTDEVTASAMSSCLLAAALAQISAAQTLPSTPRVARRLAGCARRPRPAPCRRTMPAIPRPSPRISAPKGVATTVSSQLPSTPRSAPDQSRSRHRPHQTAPARTTIPLDSGYRR